MRRPTVLALLLLLSVSLALADDGYPRTPTAVKDILYARPFTLEQGYHSYWHPDVPLVTSGYLVVVKFDADLGRPQAAAMPVLVTDSSTVEMFNFGYPSGIGVGVVPGPLDLARTRFYFAPPPDGAMTAGKIAASRVEAEAAAIRPLAAKRVQEALARGGKPLRLEKRAQLVKQARALVESYGAN